MEQKRVWRDIYPELVNKVRWAVCSTFATSGSSFPYSAGQVIATVFSQYIVDVVKLADEAPGVLLSTSTLRGSLLQERIRTELDKQVL